MNVVYCTDVFFCNKITELLESWMCVASFDRMLDSYDRKLDRCEGVHVFGVSQARQSLGLPKLSLKQRIIGFCISLSIAAAFAVLVSAQFH